MFHAVLWAGKESDLLDLIDMSNFAKPENALKRAEGDRYYFAFAMW